MFAKIFISLFVICTIFGSLVAQPVDQSACPQICPDLYDPVCASDDTTYQEFANSCEMEILNCNKQQQRNKTFKTTVMDWCRTEKIDNWNDLLVKLGNPSTDHLECSNVCDRSYKPLCITNGKYRALASNPCFMDNINCVLANEDKFRVLQNDRC